MKKLPSTKDNIFSGLIFLGLVFLWEYIVQQGYLPKYILPAPSDIIKVLFESLSDLQSHIYTTLSEAFTGFTIAIALAVVLAVMMDSIAVIKRILYPLIVISQTVPIIAVAPLFVIWFGFGILPKIIVVVLVCFFPVLISLLEGMSSVDGDLLNLLKIMGANRMQVYSLVKFPASLVSFFSGLRIAATYSIMGAVIGEWLGGEKGLGVYMIRVKHSYALDKVFAAIVIIVLLSMFVFKIITVIQHILMPWDRVND